MEADTGALFPYLSVDDLDDEQRHVLREPHPISRELHERVALTDRLVQAIRRIGPKWESYVDTRECHHSFFRPRTQVGDRLRDLRLFVRIYESMGMELRHLLYGRVIRPIPDVVRIPVQHIRNPVGHQTTDGTISQALSIAETALADHAEYLLKQANDYLDFLRNALGVAKLLHAQAEAWVKDRYCSVALELRREVPNFDELFISRAAPEQMRRRAAIVALYRQTLQHMDKHGAACLELEMLMAFGGYRNNPRQRLIVEYTKNRGELAARALIVPDWNPSSRVSRPPRYRTPRDGKARAAQPAIENWRQASVTRYFPQIRRIRSARGVCRHESRARKAHGKSLVDKAEADTAGSKGTIANSI